MRLQHRRPTPIRARHTTLIDKSTRRTRRSANLDLVLRPSRRPTRIEAAALPDRGKQVVVIAVLRDERAFLGVRPRRLVRDASGGSARGDGERRVVHLDAVDVAPKRAEGHDDVGAVPVGGWVDGVVGGAGAGGDAGCAVVGPVVEVGGGCYADGAVLVAEGRDTIEHVVGDAELGHVGGLWGYWLARVRCADGCRRAPTQRSSFPARLIFEPAGMAAWRYVHGPLIVWALWIAILPPVEKR